MQLNSSHVHSNIAQNRPMAFTLIKHKMFEVYYISLLGYESSFFHLKFGIMQEMAPKTRMVSVYGICDLIQVAIKLYTGRT